MESYILKTPCAPSEDLCLTPSFSLIAIRSAYTTHCSLYIYFLYFLFCYFSPSFGISSGLTSLYIHWLLYGTAYPFFFYFLLMLFPMRITDSLLIFASLIYFSVVDDFYLDFYAYSAWSVGESRTGQSACIAQNRTTGRIERAAETKKMTKTEECKEKNTNNNKTNDDAAKSQCMCIIWSSWMNRNEQVQKLYGDWFAKCDTSEMREA